MKEAWRDVPAKKRNKTLKAEMATKILHAAAGGERDPKRLKEVALGRPDPFELPGLAKQVAVEAISGKAATRTGKKRA